MSSKTGRDGRMRLVEHGGRSRYVCYQGVVYVGFTTGAGVRNGVGWTRMQNVAGVASRGQEASGTHDRVPPAIVGMCGSEALCSESC